MRKNVMRKNLQQTILKSITRYIAIVLIIALGAAIFVGLRSTKTDMIEMAVRAKQWRKNWRKALK